MRCIYSNFFFIGSILFHLPEVEATCSTFADGTPTSTSVQAGTNCGTNTNGDEELCLEDGTCAVVETCGTSGTLCVPNGSLTIGQIGSGGFCFSTSNSTTCSVFDTAMSCDVSNEGRQCVSRAAPELEQRPLGMCVRSSGSTGSGLTCVDRYYGYAQEGTGEKQCQDPEDIGQFCMVSRGTSTTTEVRLGVCLSYAGDHSGLGSGNFNHSSRCYVLNGIDSNGTNSVTAGTAKCEHANNGKLCVASESVQGSDTVSAGSGVGPAGTSHDRVRLGVCHAAAGRTPRCVISNMYDYYNAPNAPPAVKDGSRGSCERHDETLCITKVRDSFLTISHVGLCRNDSAWESCTESDQAFITDCSRTDGRGNPLDDGEICLTASNLVGACYNLQCRAIDNPHKDCSFKEVGQLTAHGNKADSVDIHFCDDVSTSQNVHRDVSEDIATCNRESDANKYCLDGFGAEMRLGVCSVGGICFPMLMSTAAQDGVCTSKEDAGKFCAFEESAGDNAIGICSNVGDTKANFGGHLDGNCRKINLTKCIQAGDYCVADSGKLGICAGNDNGTNYECWDDVLEFANLHSDDVNSARENACGIFTVAQVNSSSDEIDIVRVGNRTDSGFVDLVTETAVGHLNLATQVFLDGRDEPRDCCVEGQACAFGGNLYRTTQIGRCDSGNVCRFAVSESTTTTPAPVASFSAEEESVAIVPNAGCDAISSLGCFGAADGGVCFPVCQGEGEFMVDSLAFDFLTCRDGSWGELPKCDVIPQVFAFDSNVFLRDEDCADVQDEISEALAEALGEEFVADDDGGLVFEFDGSSNGLQVDCVADTTDPVAEASRRPSILHQITVSTRGKVYADKNPNTLQGMISRKAESVRVALARNRIFRDLEFGPVLLSSFDSLVSGSAQTSISQTFFVKFSDQMGDDLFEECSDKLDEVMRVVSLEIFDVEESKVGASFFTSVESKVTSKNERVVEADLTISGTGGALAKRTLAGAKQEVATALGADFEFRLRDAYFEIAEHTCRHTVISAGTDEDELKSKYVLFGRFSAERSRKSGSFKNTCTFLLAFLLLG